MQHALNIVQVVTFLAAFIAQGSRLFVASRPFWSKLPAWYQTLLPALVPALAAAAQGLTGVKTWTDLEVLFLVCAALVMPGLPSNRSAAKLQDGKTPTLTPSAGDVAVSKAVVAKSAPSVPPLVGLMLGLLMALVTGCGLIAAASPYLAEAGLLIADANTAISAAQALLPSLHLTAAEDASAQDVLARARKALEAAAAADDGAKDLTKEQLDASLAEFRAAWVDIQKTFAGKHIGATAAGSVLPTPRAMRRIYK